MPVVYANQFIFCMKFLKYFFVAGSLFMFAACDGGEAHEEENEVVEKETMVGKDPEGNNKTKVEFDANEDGGSLDIESENTDISISSDDGE